MLCAKLLSTFALPPTQSVNRIGADFLRRSSPRDRQVRTHLKLSHSTGHVARILVVEDFPAFRRFICSKLEERLDLRVIAEVPDGLEAVQKAAELKPDLILLDIGLPTINGIEAARQIRNLSPESKIVFLSQETSPDLVKEALNTGAWGYVVKAEAASQLLAAVEAVVSGTRFVTGFCKELLGTG